MEDDPGGIVARAHPNFELYNTFATIMNAGEPSDEERRLEFELARRSVADALASIAAVAETEGSAPRS
jgi:hypothetical protein